MKRFKFDRPFILLQLRLLFIERIHRNQFRRSMNSCPFVFGNQTLSFLHIFPCSPRNNNFPRRQSKESLRFVVTKSKLDTPTFLFFLTNPLFQYILLRNANKKWKNNKVSNFSPSFWASVENEIHHSFGKLHFRKIPHFHFFRDGSNFGLCTVTSPHPDPSHSVRERPISTNIWKKREMMLVHIKLFWL